MDSAIQLSRMKGRLIRGPDGAIEEETEPLLESSMLTPSTSMMRPHGLSCAGSAALRKHWREHLILGKNATWAISR